MPLAHLLGMGVESLVDLGRPGAKVDPRHVVLIGLRDVDAGERAVLRDLGIRAYTMRDIDERGLAAVMHEALTYVAALPRVHVSFDMDSLDPQRRTRRRHTGSGGFSYREAHLMMEMLAESGKVTSLDIVEINPILDDRNRTAHEAVELAASLLGASIL